MKFWQEQGKVWEEFPFRMFYFGRSEQKSKNAKRWHKEYIELFYIRQGGLTFFIHERRYSLRKKQVMLINQNETYSVTAEPESEVLVIQIPVISFKGYIKKEEEFFFKNQCQEAEADIGKLLNEMADIFEKKEYAYELEVQAKFYQLLHRILLKYGMAEKRNGEILYSGGQGRLSEILNYMQENYTQEITLESLAEEFGFSSVYLSRMFKKYGNMNFKQYLQKIRLEHAYHDLLNSDQSIGEIALQNGFPSAKSLTTAFKQYYYCLPSDYRKNEGEGIGKQTAFR